MSRVTELRRDLVGSLHRIDMSVIHAVNGHVLVAAKEGEPHSALCEMFPDTPQGKEELLLTMAEVAGLYGARSKRGPGFEVKWLDEGRGDEE